MALGQVDEGQRTYEELLQGNRHYDFRAGRSNARPGRLTQHRALPASRENVSDRCVTIEGKPVGMMLQRTTVVRIPDGKLSSAIRLVRAASRRRELLNVRARSYLVDSFFAI